MEMAKGVIKCDQLFQVLENDVIEQGYPLESSECVETINVAGLIQSTVRTSLKASQSNEIETDSLLTRSSSGTFMIVCLNLCAYSILTSSLAWTNFRINLIYFENFPFPQKFVLLWKI